MKDSRNSCKKRWQHLFITISWIYWFSSFWHYQIMLSELIELSELLINFNITLNCRIDLWWFKKCLYSLCFCHWSWFFISIWSWWAWFCYVCIHNLLAMWFIFLLFFFLLFLIFFGFNNLFLIFFCIFLFNQIFFLTIFFKDIFSIWNRHSHCSLHLFSFIFLIWFLIILLNLLLFIFIQLNFLFLLFNSFLIINR